MWNISKPVSSGLTSQILHPDVRVVYKITNNPLNAIQLRQFMNSCCIKPHNKAVKDENPCGIFGCPIVKPRGVFAHYKKWECSFIRWAFFTELQSH